MNLDVLDLLEQDGFYPARKGTREFCSPCPSCGGMDRFTVFLDENRQRYWCRQCEIKGDAIDYLRNFRSMSFPEAAEYVGKQIDQTSSRPTSIKNFEQIKPPEPLSPPPLWRERAQSFISAAHNNLMNKPKQLSWLAQERGISQATVSRFQLGWMDTDYWQDRSSFGLPANGKKLFLPSGLVIPYDDRRIRIRRDNPGNYGRYYLLPGSSTEPMVIGSPEYSIAIIVESDLDAILLAQELKQPVYLVSLGSAQARPDSDLLCDLQKCTSVLVALDNDDAGSAAAYKWRTFLPSFHRTLTPSEYGKDVTEAYLRGLNLRAWLEASINIASTR